MAMRLSGRVSNADDFRQLFVEERSDHMLMVMQSIS